MLDFLRQPSLSNLLDTGDTYIHIINPEMITGVIAGIISSGLFAFLIFILRSYILPRISDLVYKTPNISGEWQVMHPTKGNDLLGTAKIKQSGAIIQIIIKIIRRKNGEQSNRTFINKGRFCAGQVITIFEEPKNRAYNIGASILKLSSNGRELKGCVTYFHHDSGQMITNNFLLKRNE